MRVLTKIFDEVSDAGYRGEVELTFTKKTAPHDSVSVGLLADGRHDMFLMIDVYKNNAVPAYLRSLAADLIALADAVEGA